jgi:spermidine synthase
VFPLLAVLFFFSGVSALIYQVVWLRLLALIFGVTVHAASAVLTSFMGGLALGAWAGGKLADRLRRPLLGFALIELGIAATALAVPIALDAVGTIYGALHARAPGDLARLTVARVLCSGLILLVPTTLMGASLPMLARDAAARGGAVAGRIGTLYATNTGGGIAGTLLAGFVLIGGIGIVSTTRLAAAVNVAVGLGALLLGGARLAASAGHAASSAHETHAAQPDSAAAPALYSSRTILVVVALAGFAGLALEVVWFRLLTLFLPATTYAFTTMLATVLLGIAAGSAIAAARVRRSPDPASTLAWIQIAAGILVLLSMTALVQTYRLGWRTSGTVQACIVAMLPAATLMGATFPFALRIWLGQEQAAVGRRVGLLYAVNVCGAVAGALVGGFVLLPMLGGRASLVVLAAVYVGAGCLLMASVASRRAFVVRAAAASALFAASAVTLPDLYAALLARRYGGNERLVFRAEGVQTTATVHYHPSGHRILYLDGLHQANDTEGMVRVHAEIGHLPMVLHRDPKRALVVGLGGGVTAGAVAAHRRTATDVVELAASVVAAAPFFVHVNGDVLRQPHVTLRVDDGRNFLRMTSRKYDVLTADIIQPIHAGAGNLYSVEYFALARRVLRDGGLMLQWIGHREEAHYKLIMRTFLQVFPEATLWADGSLMVGSLDPLRFGRASFERKLQDPDVAFGLARVRLDTFDALTRRYTAGPDEMRRFVGDGSVLTDDRPLLEYHRSLTDPGRPLDLSTLRGDVRRHLER